MPPEDNKLKIGLDPVFKSAQNNPSGSQSIVRTYKSDLESAIQNDHLSSINIAIAESKKKQEEAENKIEEVSENEYSKSKIIIFISILLVIIGIIALVITYYLKSPNVSKVTITSELPSMITTEYKEELNIGTIIKDNLAKALSSKLNDTQIPVNNIYNVYLTTGTSSRQLISSANFISMIKFNMPDMVKRTLLPNFMIGSYSFSQNYPFLILKTSSFENSYAGMLAWEKDLSKDFQLLFRLPGYENSGSLLDELTPATSTKKFEDGVIVNKDVRFLQDNNNNTIIITVSDTAFKEIIDRLNKEKSLKR